MQERVSGANKHTLAKATLSIKKRKRNTSLKFPEGDPVGLAMMKVSFHYDFQICFTPSEYQTDGLIQFYKLHIWLLGFPRKLAYILLKRDSPFHLWHSLKRQRPFVCEISHWPFLSRSELCVQLDFTKCHERVFSSLVQARFDSGRRMRLGMGTAFSWGKPHSELRVHLEFTSCHARFFHLFFKSRVGEIWRGKTDET